MAYWSPEIMLQQKRVVDMTLSEMEAQNQELLKNLNSYNAIIQDDVARNTKDMIVRVDALISEIKERVKKQTDIMEKAAKGLFVLENSASGDIKGIK